MWGATMTISCQLTMCFIGKDHPEPWLGYLTLSIAKNLKFLTHPFNLTPLDDVTGLEYTWIILALLFIPLNYFPKRAIFENFLELDFLSSLSLSLALQHALLKSLIVTLWLLPRWHRQDKSDIMSKFCILENNSILCSI